jgi:hypothetical protein
MSSGNMILLDLKKMFHDWEFINIDVIGRSGGIITGWNLNFFCCSNSWATVSGLGTTLFFESLGEAYTFINIYGPYQNHVPFWDTLFQSDMLKPNKVILDGDLNFSIGEAEIWGPHAHRDNLSDYFIRKLEENKFFDIIPHRLNPTWRNMRSGDQRIAKILDRFLVNEGILNTTDNIRQWNGSGGDSNHFLIILEASFGRAKPPSPFKFNTCWLDHEDYVQMVKTQWQLFDETNNVSACLQFHDNLKRIKTSSLAWALDHRKAHDASLSQIE